ncbi:MAG: hypothetical protein M0R74_18145, partial [Dehalococcoidia bacterium]|nr:hypothetical protein [Dehalococcoidia bacterium]
MTHRFGQPSASRVAVLMALAAVLMLILSPSKPATAQVINPWVYGFASTETESVIEYGPPTFVTVKRTCTSSCAYGSSSVSYTIRFYGAASEELGSTMGSVPFSGTSNEVTVDWPSGGSGIRASREVYPAGTKSMTITLRSSFTGGTIDPARSTKTLTIVENPPVISFDQAEYTVEEGSKVTITVRRERPGDTSRVSWELSDVPSSDYQVLEGASPLEFTGSQTTRQIVLSMKKVPSAWKPRVGTLTLSAPVYGKLGTSSIATLTVVGASSDLPVITRLNPNEGWTSGGLV